jgi:hypothetical protein
MWRFRTVEKLVEAIMRLPPVLAGKQIGDFVDRSKTRAELVEKERAERDAERTEGEYFRSWDP